MTSLTKITNIRRFTAQVEKAPGRPIPDTDTRMRGAWAAPSTKYFLKHFFKQKPKCNNVIQHNMMKVFNKLQRANKPTLSLWMLYYTFTTNLLFFLREKNDRNNRMRITWHVKTQRDQRILKAFFTTAISFCFIKTVKSSRALEMKPDVFLIAVYLINSNPGI